APVELERPEVHGVQLRSGDLSGADGSITGRHRQVDRHQRRVSARRRRSERSQSAGARHGSIQSASADVRDAVEARLVREPAAGHGVDGAVWIYAEDRIPARDTVYESSTVGSYVHRLGTAELLHRRDAEAQRNAEDCGKATTKKGQSQRK